jgi:hypothetical protein
MVTTQTQQLTGNEATLINSARAQLKSFADKLRVLCDDADQALIGMDAQLQDFDAAHPERSEFTTSQRKQAEKERDERVGR